MYVCPFKNLSPPHFSFPKDDLRIRYFVISTSWPVARSGTLLFVYQNHPVSRWPQESEVLPTVRVPFPLTVGYEAFSDLVLYLVTIEKIE